MPLFGPLLLGLAFAAADGAAGVPAAEVSRAATLNVQTVAPAASRESAVVASGVGPATTAITPPGTALKLAPPKPGRTGEARRPAFSPPSGPMASMLLSLAAVLGLFFMCAWIFRGGKGKSGQALPKDVIEVLGRAPFNGRHQLQLVRVGRKLLLITVSPTGSETLTEISEPQEVDRLVAICQQNNPSSITATFRQVLQQIGSEPAPAGFWGKETRV